MAIPTLHTTINVLKHNIANLGDRFQRKGVWSPATVMTMLLLLKAPGYTYSYRSILALSNRLNSDLLSWKVTPTIGSMSKARNKLSPTLCHEFQQQLAEQVTRSLHQPRHVWKGRRIVAIDGSTFVVPRSKDTLKHFRCPKGGADVQAHHPRALVVMALDVTRRVPIASVVGTKGVGERTLIKQLLPCLQPDDVVVIDRGFPSRALLLELTKLGIDVIMRVSTGKTATWKEFRTFMDGNQKSAEIQLELGTRQEPVRVQARLVERDKKRGRPRKGTKKERMVILTTLKAEDGFTRAELLKIYQARWGVETAFRELKTFLNTEPFHSKTAIGIEQEVIIGQIWMTLASLLESTALDAVPDGYQVIRTDCYRFASVLLSDFLAGTYCEDEFIRLVEELRRYAQKRSPNRYAERTCNVPYGRSQKQFG